MDNHSMTRNIIIIAVGQLYRDCAEILIDGLRRSGYRDRITCLTDSPLSDTTVTYQCVSGDLQKFENRILKTQMFGLTDADITLYLDADVSISGNFDDIWGELGEYDIAMIAGHGDGHQGAMDHSSSVCTDEYRLLRSYRPQRFIPYYNSGIILWRNSPTINGLFSSWYNEWLKFRRTDQTALYRALVQSEIHVKELPSRYRKTFPHKLISVNNYVQPIKPLNRADAILARLNHGLIYGAEVGVLRGRTSRWLLGRGNLDLSMVDSWLATGGDSHVQPQMDLLFQQAMFLTEPYAQHRHIFKQSSIDAAKAFSVGTFDFVFIDDRNVPEDLTAWYPLIKDEGWIGGYAYDRWHPKVVRVVNEFVDTNGLSLELDRDTTWFASRISRTYWRTSCAVLADTENNSRRKGDYGKWVYWPAD